MNGLRQQCLHAHCSELMGVSCSCCWRAGSSAKLKPNARRLEITLPLDTQSGNYQEMQDEQKRIKTLQLRCAMPCCARHLQPP
jgi:hypothetical protein